MTILLSWRNECADCDCDDHMARSRECKTHLVFFQKTPFLTFERLGALSVIAPLYGVAHGRHDCCFYCDVTATLLTDRFTIRWANKELVGGVM